MCGVFAARVGARPDLNTPSHHCWHQTRKVMQPFDIVGMHCLAKRTLKCAIVANYFVALPDSNSPRIQYYSHWVHAGTVDKNLVFNTRY